MLNKETECKMKNEPFGKSTEKLPISVPNKRGIENDSLMSFLFKTKLTGVPGVAWDLWIP